MLLLKKTKKHLICFEGALPIKGVSPLLVMLLYMYPKDERGSVLVINPGSSSD